MSEQTQWETLDNLPEPFRTRAKSTLKPMLRLEADGPSQSVLDSKVGGVPYRPIGMDWPTDAETGPLLFLAQLNFAQLPALEGFPARGILQFFIGRNDLFGCSFMDGSGSDIFQTRWFSEPLQDTSQLETDPASVPPPAEEDEFCTPLGGSGDVRLRGILQQQPMTSRDRLFETVVGLDFLDDSPSPVEGHKMGLWREISYQELSEDDPHHQVGGYPYFTQTDPRGEDSPLVLLFQLDSDDDLGLMWGDMGVANFFIHPDDLARQDFSNVTYNWDCC